MIDAASLRAACRHKEVFIWGAMIVGQGVCRALERHGITVRCFVDASSALQGQSALGYPIHAPEPAIDAALVGKGLIIAASGHHDLDIGSLCEAQGLKKGVGYILCRDLNAIDPSVDVAGMCNLRCMSCPRGNDPWQPPKGCMSAATYEKVLAKLLDEIPMLGSIQLYTWGEPLLNAELPAIVRLTREVGVLSAISSNLNHGKQLEQVVAARPDWFKVSCSGWGESYELTHTGGKWNVFLPNLRRLAALRDDLHPDMQITVNYHLYKHNLGSGYRRMEQLCRELRLIFRPSPAYLYPADTVMAYVNGEELSENARRTIPMLMMGLDRGLAAARAKAHLPCPEERCFPINWDGAVRTCGIFYRPFIARNFLDEPLETILERKQNCSLCVTCKKLGIHQFTGVYLSEKRLENDRRDAEDRP